MADFPESYKDPTYTSLDSKNEQKYGLPSGLISAIRTEGEKTDASKVSSAGARTPYQFTPATRRGILDKYGIDVYLSPENASEGAAILLRDSLKRNNNDPEMAVREYHGGTNRDAWGKVNDAYWSRVGGALQSAKIQDLSKQFGEWMNSNAATGGTPGMPQAQAPQVSQGQGTNVADKSNGNLEKDFSAWMEAGYNRPPDEQVDRITQSALNPGQSYQPQPVPVPQTLGDKLIGTGEAALNLGTGATSGLLGMVGGGLASLPELIARNDIPQSEKDRLFQEAAAKGGQALTYQPRTDAGRDIAKAGGELLQETVPAIPLVAELGLASAAARAAGGAALDVAPGVIKGAANAAKQAPARVMEMVRGPTDNQATATAGTQGSVGAAGADAAMQRVQRAQDLPVPIDLTKGQAERSFEGQRFERETAKNLELGAPIRDRFEQQQQQFVQNMDSFIDATGAEAPNLREAGTAVYKSLRDRAARDKAEIRSAYKAAEKAGELRDPVAVDPVINLINQSAPAEALAPIVNGAKKEAVRLGLASVDDTGNLVAREGTLNDVEALRKFINKNAGTDPTNIKYASDLKRQIDLATENAGGDIYRSARRLRENFINRFENRSVISRILETKRGTNDRQVAFEDVFNHSILNGSLDDARAVRNVLTTSGADGVQAWKELQGQTLQYLKDQATRSSQMDSRSNPVISAAGLDRAVKSLDREGKLDFIFTKRGAQKIRDLNDIAKDLVTSPPGSVNHSNTASVLSAAFDMMLSGASGFPAPVASGIRVISQRIKDKNLRRQIQEALTYSQRTLRK